MTLGDAFGCDRRFSNASVSFMYACMYVCIYMPSHSRKDGRWLTRIHEIQKGECKKYIEAKCQSGVEGAVLENSNVSSPKGALMNVS